MNKNLTSDIEEHNKTMKAIAPLDDGKFKHRLLFAQWKSALKDASNAAERSAYMNTYAMALKNPKLRNLAQSYFQTLQKLGKGNDAPNFIAKNLENNTVNLNDYKGQYEIGRAHV